MSISGRYLTLFPTPGGDKYHMFNFDGKECTVTNDRGPTALENVEITELGFSGDMPAGMTTHHFAGILEGSAINVKGSVIDSANGAIAGEYEGLLNPYFSEKLPSNPEAPEGHGGPPMGGPPPSR